MLNRIVAPAVNAVEEITLPPIQTRSLPNGARLHVLPGGTQPIVRLELVFKAGKWYETKAGVSHLTAKMLTEGTKSFSARQIADQVAFYGASLECHNGFDRTTITLYCLSKFFLQLLPLVKEIALWPSFPEPEFRLLLQRTIQNISIERKRTSYVATETFTNLIYGVGHPYTTGIKESELNQVTLQDLQAFNAGYYALGNCEIFLTGQVDELLEETVNTFGSEPSGNQIQIKEYSLLEKAISEPVFAEMPESMQASVRVGCTVINRKHPDYFPMLIFNEILGGYFGSRLMKNIREDKGFTYGIYSTISAKEHNALFYIATDVNYQSVSATLTEIEKELKLLQTEKVGPVELETVQNYMTGKFLNSITSTFEQADKHKNIILSDLPSDYYTKYVDSIRTITSDKIQEIGNVYFNKPLLEVVAGKKS